MGIRAVMQAAATAFGATLLGAANAAAAQSTLALVPGTNVQAYAANLAGAYGQKLLAVKTGAALNSTADQALTMIGAATKYVVTAVVFTNASGTPVLAAGSIYTAASKGGTLLFTVAQVYTALSATTKILLPTLASAVVTDVVTSAQLYLSLTTANVATVTADVYVFGMDLS